MTGSRVELPLEVRHVRDALADEFEGHIVSEGAPARFFSGALAAKAVQLLTDRSTAEAVEALTDGPRDCGIDAVVCSTATCELWLVQTKWSDQGTASFSKADAYQLIRGFRLLDNEEFERMGTRFQVFADDIRRILTSPTAKVHLVAAVMGEARPSQSAREVIQQDLASDLAGALDFRILSIADFHTAVGEKQEPVTVTATFSEGWFAHELPYSGYVGTVTGAEVAYWFQEHGMSLMARNIRAPLENTEVNQQLLASPLKEPAHFWYLNNGITVICDRATPEFFATRAPGQPVRLLLDNPSVVNGGQTTAALYRVYENNPQDLADVRVMLRIISSKDAPAGFVDAVTVATNTQNHVERRDFVALDDVQARIREDFALSLGKTYVVKRGDREPAPQTGCTVLEAATALACSHPDPAVVSRTLSATEVLWEPAPDGVYTQLFGEQPSAHQIWHSVLLLRAVQEAVRNLSSRLYGRPASIAERSAPLIAHIIFQRTDLEDRGTDWEPPIPRLRDQVAKVLALLIATLDQRFGPDSLPSSVFGNAARCRELVDAVLAAIDGPIPELRLRAAPPRPRRANSVQILIDRGRLPEGTQLMYRPGPAEEHAIGDWLDADPRRFVATWTDDPARPLVWAADDQAYSPSALTKHIWRLADWSAAPVAVRGSARWALPGGATLADLAEELDSDADV